VLGEFPGPLVAVAMPAALARQPCAANAQSRRALNRTALWLLWLAAGMVAFSASRLGSPHYLEAFSPRWPVSESRPGALSQVRK
jgi:hypothetical protein